MGGQGRYERGRLPAPGRRSRGAERRPERGPVRGGGGVSSRPGIWDDNKGSGSDSEQSHQRGRAALRALIGAAIAATERLASRVACGGVAKSQHNQVNRRLAPPAGAPTSRRSQKIRALSLHRHPLPTLDLSGAASQPVRQRAGDGWRRSRGAERRPERGQTAGVSTSGGEVRRRSRVRRQRMA